MPFPAQFCLVLTPLKDSTLDMLQLVHALFRRRRQDRVTIVSAQCNKGSCDEGDDDDGDDVIC